MNLHKSVAIWKQLIIILILNHQMHTMIYIFFLSINNCIILRDQCEEVGR